PMVAPAAADLTRKLRAAVTTLGAEPALDDAGAASAPFGGPRRLVAYLSGLLERGEGRGGEGSGQPVAAGYGQEGSPTKAALGFARAQGVEVEQLERVRGEKGEVVSARRKEIGRMAASVLADVCPRILASLRFPKMMKWGDRGYTFVRPVHWIVALLDGDVVE